MKKRSIVSILLYVVILFAEMMITKLQLKAGEVMVCLFSGLIIPYMLSALVRLLQMPGGKFFVVIPIVMAFLSDTGAYFIGIFFGKHKMAPVISPNKSIEGVIGGMAAGIAGMLLYAAVMQFVFGCQVHYGYAFVYGLFGSLVDVFGDLCFSTIKRQTGIKDYGDLIPGHGGVLDRFDSMIFVAPFAEILLITLPVVVK